MGSVASTLNNRYRLDKKIGEGGFAQVFLATDLELGRQVAVKVLEQNWAQDLQLLAHFRYQRDPADRYPTCQALCSAYYEALRADSKRATRGYSCNKGKQDFSETLLVDKQFSSPSQTPGSAHVTMQRLSDSTMDFRSHLTKLFRVNQSIRSSLKEKRYLRKC